MNNRIRHVLTLKDPRSAGRWFAVVLLVGFLAMGYVVISNWSANTTWQRVKGIATLMLIVVFAIPYATAGPRHRRSKTVDPTA